MNLAQNYEQDLLAWSENQIELLKKGEFQKLDMEHIIEELEAVGRSDQHAIYSYLVILFTHILKCKYQPEMVCNSWLKSIENAIAGIRKILKRSPSYRKYLKEDCKDAYQLARKNAHYETGIELEKFPFFDEKECDTLIHDLFNKEHET